MIHLPEKLLREMGVSDVGLPQNKDGDVEVNEDHAVAIAAMSMAVSLKRIADALERNVGLVDKIAACVSEEKAMIRADTF